MGPRGAPSSLPLRAGRLRPDSGPRGAQLGGGPAGPRALLSLPAKKYKKVTGKEIYSDTLESTPMLEKEKFPQDYFPEVRGSEAGAGPGAAERTRPAEGCTGRSAPCRYVPAKGLPPERWEVPVSPRGARRARGPQHARGRVGRHAGR